MRCPVCGCSKDRVLDTRTVDDDRSIRRRRECANCQHRYTSYEVVEDIPLIVCKRDHTRELFDKEKALEGLKKACQKRPISLRQMRDLIDQTEADFRNNLRAEITTVEIGEKLMVGLRELDEVAYIRFASVYRQFEDVESFLTELKKLKNMKARAARLAAKENEEKLAKENAQNGENKDASAGAEQPKPETPEESKPKAKKPQKSKTDEAALLADIPEKPAPKKRKTKS